jgi:hypothetical protein
MAGKNMFPTLIARADVDLLPGFVVFGGRARIGGSDLCLTGH